MLVCVCFFYGTMYDLEIISNNQHVFRFPFSIYFACLPAIAV